MHVTGPKNWITVGRTYATARWVGALKANGGYVVRVEEYERKHMLFIPAKSIDELREIFFEVPEPMKP